MTSAAWDWQSAYPAPAKLNLFLHVVGRRTDGYHLLQTAFRLVDRADELRFSPRTDDRVVLVTPLPGVPQESDLTVRAAKVLQAHTGCRQGVDIEVRKRLPMGGGLGGGSSDAATVLVALNHLWRLDLSRARLQEIGLSLGADVPVFVFGQNAFAEGVGERLSPLRLPSAWYVVLEPPVGVPTAAVFGAPELKRDTVAIDATRWHPGFGTNDLQPVAVSRFPDVARHLEWLAQFGEARMSGSGACVFTEVSGEEEAKSILTRMPQGMRGWAAPGLNQHPLAELVGALP